jgi:hypothetical protein
MWQHHYLLHQARMDSLRAEADRERTWRLQDAANGRAVGRAAARPAGRMRAAIAGSLAAASRAGARLARRLDERVVLDLGTDRLLRDA